MPEFFKTIYFAKKGEVIYLKGVQCKATFLKLVEYLYCDKFVENILPVDVRAMAEICATLGLNTLSNLMKRKADYARMKIH